MEIGKGKLENGKKRSERPPIFEFQFSNFSAARIGISCGNSEDRTARPLHWDQHSDPAPRRMLAMNPRVAPVAWGPGAENRDASTRRGADTTFLAAKTAIGAGAHGKVA
jgi:hypothetical protein